MPKKSKKKDKTRAKLALAVAAPDPKKRLRPPALTSKRVNRLASPTRTAARARRRFIYFFGAGRAEGNVQMAELLGAKGASLAEMTQIGLPVPPGFTLTTEVCARFHAQGRLLPPDLEPAIAAAIRRVERMLGKKFGCGRNPLLFAVRSGARQALPGLLQTVLNLGLNDETVEGLVRASHNERFAYDCYRRLIQVYGDVVMGVGDASEDPNPFARALQKLKHELFPERKTVDDRELDCGALRELIVRFKALIRQRTGRNFPTDPHEQLRGAVAALFDFWIHPRMHAFRQQHGIPVEWGTAINVQAMVFGNTGDQSCSGSTCTRDPATGEKIFAGRYLLNAQGEELIDGARRPEGVATLQEKIPGAYRDLEQVRGTLEKHFRELQDIEFTVENGRLFLLQTRPGPCAGPAAVRLAVEMAREKLITWPEAVARVPVEPLATLAAGAAGRGLPETLHGASALPRSHVAASNGRELDAGETNLKQLLVWADKMRRLQVRVSAEEPAEIKQAIAQGAQGVGLWRLDSWIAAQHAEAHKANGMRSSAPDEGATSGPALLASLRRDLLEIFRTLHGLPISICLLEPDRFRSSPNKPEAEANAGPPSAWPSGAGQASAWQVRAIFEAASEAQREGLRVRPEILLPRISFSSELVREVKQVREVAARVAREHHTRFHFLIGAVIETPRACLIAEALAREIECFYFSLPELARASLGEASTTYPSAGLLGESVTGSGAPFDRSGTGELLQLACERGRRGRPDLKIGCGISAEHDFETVHFADELGFTHVTAPFHQVGAVRLVAAQATLEATAK